MDNQRVIILLACADDYSELEITMICAGAAGVDSCQGDTGGPMTCGDNEEHCGIVSWGIGCAQARHPSVYSKTSMFVEWISENSA